jgi:tRNA(Glu) U13 pseudouridine synthase TruD
MVRMHDIDFDVQWEIVKETDEQGDYLVIEVQKVELNGIDVTKAFEGEMLSNLIERIKEAG